MLSIKLHDELPAGAAVVVLGDHLLGSWEQSKAVMLRRQADSPSVWRLCFMLPLSVSSFQFQYGLLCDGKLVLESGGWRSVVDGDQGARSDAEGGPGVQLPVPGSGRVVRGFPGFTSNKDSLFDCAEQYFTTGAGAARRGYWQGATPSPRLQPAKPTHVPPPLFIGQQPPAAGEAAQADGRAHPRSPEAHAHAPAAAAAPLLRAVASFQDLVLVAGGDDLSLVSPGGGGYDDRAVSPARTDGSSPGEAAPMAPGMQEGTAAGVTDAVPDQESLRLGVRAPQRVESALDEEPCATPDAARAAAAAAVSNTQSMFALGRPGERSARTGSRLGPSAGVQQQHSAKSPPFHLEMQSSVPDGVLDASAVNFVLTPRAAGGKAADATDRRRLAIVLVGLPARGKSFTAHKLARYLTWLGFPTKHFNVGKYRRDFVGSKCDAEFFDPANERAVASRNAVARLAMEDMLGWMERGGHCGIFDATNSTRERRAMISDLARGRCKLVFLEVVCTDAALIRRNVMEKVTSSPDYAGTDPEAGLADFMNRMGEYEKVYVPLADAAGAPTEATTSFIRVVDMASGAGSMTVNRIQGYLAGRIVYFLLNTQLAFRPVYLCRHGQSEDNQAGRIGGDSALAPAGRDFSLQLRRFIDSLPQEQRPSAVWTSTLRRTVQTARPLAALPQVQWRALDEIDAGMCEGLTYDQVMASMPEEFAARQKDKLRYRYPRGESYLDVIQRLEPAIIEIERQRNPVLIIAHQAVLRCLYGYFMSRAVEDVPHLPMPLHTVIQLTPSSYGVQEQWHTLMQDPAST